MSELLTFFQFEFFDFPLDDPVRNNFSQGTIAPAFGYFDHVDNRQKFGEQKEQKDKHSYTGKGQKPFYRRYTIVYIFRSHVLQRKQGSFQCWDDDQVSFTQSANTATTETAVILLIDLNLGKRITMIGNTTPTMAAKKNHHQYSL